VRVRANAKEEEETGPGFTLSLTPSGLITWKFPKMSASIADPFVLSTYALPKTASSAGHVFATHCAIPGRSEPLVVVTAQADGVHILDVSSRLFICGRCLSVQDSPPRSILSSRARSGRRLRSFAPQSCGASTASAPLTPPSNPHRTCLRPRRAARYGRGRTTSLQACSATKS
jgi:hypothetical protein